MLTIIATVRAAVRINPTTATILTLVIRVAGDVDTAGTPTARTEVLDARHVPWAAIFTAASDHFTQLTGCTVRPAWRLESSSFYISFILSSFIGCIGYAWCVICYWVLGFEWVSLYSI